MTATQEKDLVIYDMDDTLFPNFHFFVTAKVNFMDLVLGANRTSEQSLELLTLFESINIANIPKLGYTPLRFGTSLKEAYVMWQTQRGATIDEAVASQVYTIGMEVATPQKIIQTGLYPGTLDVLAQHASRFDKLVLLTKGHRPTQEMKIAALRIADWFDDIHIVEDSKEHVFASYSGHKGRKFAIGNSVKSDVIPALKYGFNGVHMPRDTWEHELVAPESIPKEVVTIHDMPALLTYFKHL